jgi:hypothetical protein
VGWRKGEEINERPETAPAKGAGRSRRLPGQLARDADINIREEFLGIEDLVDSGLIIGDRARANRTVIKKHHH